MLTYRKCPYCGARPDKGLGPLSALGPFQCRNCEGLLQNDVVIHALCYATFIGALELVTNCVTEPLERRALIVCLAVAFPLTWRRVVPVRKYPADRPEQ